MNTGKFKIILLFLTYPLHHDTVHAHVSRPSGEVKEIDPGEGKWKHQRSDIFRLTTDI